MATVAVLGIGLLGEGFALNLIDKGHTVQVYNRTASKCARVAEAGGTVADSPEAAVRGVDRVHLVLSDDPVVDKVIAALLPGLTDGTPIIDHSTNLPELVAERVPRLAAQGVTYVHAPVFMAPVHSRSATGLMLVAGAPEVLEPLLAPLADMTGKLTVVGDTPNKAAALKIVGNGMLVGMMGVVKDLFEVGRGAGLSPSDVAGLFDTFAPSASAVAKRAIGADTSPASFELSMARKDVRLMLESAPGELIVLPAIAAAMDRAIAAGQGAKDYGILATPS